MKPRHCETCGQPYFRRNAVEVWTVRNPGHRVGWAKRIVKQCLTCQPATQSVQLLRVLRVRVSPLAVVRKHRSA